MGRAHRLAYRLIRPLLFSLDAERVHDWTIALLARASRTDGALRRLLTLERFDDPVELAGIRFPNRIGVAAGLDKEGRCIPALAAMGFGFVEVGSCAPRGETWVPPPRLHRIPEAWALINRIGLHRQGIDALCEALGKVPSNIDPRSASPVRVGVNLACNTDTPAEHALSDYDIGLARAAPYADYFTINVSNPNAANRHVPRTASELQAWMARMDEIRLARALPGRDPVPVFLKISPDLDAGDLAALTQALLENRSTRRGSGLRWGLIASNTSARRDGVGQSPQAALSGGLSGAPLKTRGDSRVRGLREALGPEFPIIAAGGVMSAQDALDRLAAGADLLQIYTGLVYVGPDLVAEIARAVRDGR